MRALSDSSLAVQLQSNILQPLCSDTNLQTDLAAQQSVL